MHLHKVLTPEIVLGTRGDASRIRHYDMILREIVKVGPGIHAKDSLFIATMDEITLQHYAAAWKFKHDQGRVYLIGRDFAQAIYKMGKDIPLDRLPEKFFAYLSFPENTLTQDGRAVKGGFIYVGPGEGASAHTAMPGQKVLWINYDFELPHHIQQRPDAFTFTSVVNFIMPVDQSLTHMINTAPLYPEADGKGDSAILRTFLNLAVYIHSLDPDLIPTRPAQQQTNKQRKQFHKTYGVTNHCTVPVTFVSWNYKQPKIFNIDSTVVMSHFRWQRCGPGFSQVKLVLIKEHERHFKRGDELSDDRS
jgi:hypothetical protein